MAEPLFLLADSAMIGHLGVVQLAGLGVASAVLQTIIGLMVFLAYATTPAVARRLGHGDERGAVSLGVDGLWLSLGLGVVIGAAGWFLSPTLVGSFGATDAVAQQADTYLGISMLGIPAMLLVFGATGLLRGLQDTTTPLVVAYLVVILRHARRTGASLRPHRAGLGGAARSGGWLFLRTVSLRAAMLIAVFVATDLGTDELAGFQLVMTLFATLAFALDALAIAAQALVGKGLGAGDVGGVRAVLVRCLQWGVGSGIVLGLVVALASPVIGLVFTSDPKLAALIVPALIVLAVTTPLGGIVFVLDGVLIGAGDAKYLAITGLLNTVVFLPFALAVLAWAPGGPTGLTWLALAFFVGYLGARATTLGLRARTSGWMRTGI